MVASLKPPPRGADTVLPDQTQPAANNRFVALDQILFFAGRLAQTGAAKRAANKAHDAVRKQFKNAGQSMGVFDLVLKMSEQEDSNALMTFIEELLHVAQAFDMLPAGTQADFFTGKGNAVDAREKAYSAGRMLGVMGKNVDSQAYPPETDLGQEHLRGWHDGQAVLKKQFLDHNERERQAEAEKKAQADEAAKRKADKDAKAAEKAGRAVPKNDEGDTVQ